MFAFIDTPCSSSPLSRSPALPSQVMALFFQMHSHFDWSRYCWCIEGPRRLDTLHSNSSSAEDPSAASYGAHAEAFVGLAGNPAPLLLSQARITQQNSGQQYVRYLYAVHDT